MVEELRVEPDDLDRFASSVRDLSTDADSAYKYVGKWFDISADEARIYAYVKGMTDQVRQNLESNYGLLRSLLERSADELTMSAQMYRTTDIDTARTLDRTYGEDK